MCVCTEEEKIRPNDKILQSQEKNILNYLSNGKKLIRLKKIDLETEFNKACEENEGADMVVVGLNRNGGPILALSKDGKIVSNIGIKIYHDSDGNKITSFILL